jgi:hypothetical protein
MKTYPLTPQQSKECKQRYFGLTAIESGRRGRGFDREGL